MNKNYYKTIDSVRPSDSAVEKSVAAALSAEQSGKATKMKQKHSYLKPLSALAACMALLIALGAIFFPRSENAFFLTANAYDYQDTKLTSNEFVPVSKLTDEGEAYIYDKDWEKVTLVLHNTQINLNCEGKNIDTVTYSIKNAIIGVNKKSKKVLASTGKQDYFFDTGTLGDAPFSKSFGRDDNYYYKSITTSYKNQLDLKKDSVEIFSQYEITDKNRELFEKYFKYNQPVDLYVDEVDKAEYKNAIESYYKDIYKNIAVTVTVKYKDGSVESKQIKFDVICDILTNRVTKDEETPRDGEVYRYEVKLRAKVF